MTKKEIADILKKCRICAGFTQKEAASRLGRPQQTLASWETGKSQPDANTLFSLCDLYGVSVNEAFGYPEAQQANLSGVTLSKEEMSIIKKYRALDERGKSAVLAVLEHEYEAAGGGQTDSLSHGA